MSISMERWECQQYPPLRLREENVGARVWSTECHYCGFAWTPGEAPPARCPKCGGSAWELSPIPGKLLRHAQRTPGHDSTADPIARETPTDDANRAAVLFRVRCEGAQVYLLLSADGAGAKVIPLRQSQQNEWHARLRLAPGAYRYRFYVDDGVHLVYLPTSQITGKDSTGLDGWLLVPSGDEMNE